MTASFWGLWRTHPLFRYFLYFRFLNQEACSTSCCLFGYLLSLSLFPADSHLTQNVPPQTDNHVEGWRCGVMRIRARSELFGCWVLGRSVEFATVCDRIWEGSWWLTWALAVSEQISWESKNLNSFSQRLFFPSIHGFMGSLTQLHTLRVRRATENWEKQWHSWVLSQDETWDAWPLPVTCWEAYVGWETGSKQGLSQTTVLATGSPKYFPKP